MIYLTWLAWTFGYQPRGEGFAKALASDILDNSDRHENRAGHGLVAVNRICAGHIQKGCNLDVCRSVSHEDHDHLCIDQSVEHPPSKGWLYSLSSPTYTDI